MNNDKNIQLIDLANSYPNLTISIKCSDLIDAFRSIIEETKLHIQHKIIEEDTEIYLNEDKVIEMLEISHSTLWRWHKVEYLVPVKIGRKIRYKKSEIDSILNINQLKNKNYEK